MVQFVVFIISADIEVGQKTLLEDVHLFFEEGFVRLNKRKFLEHFLHIFFKSYTDIGSKTW